MSVTFENVGKIELDNGLSDNKPTNTYAALTCCDLSNATTSKMMAFMHSTKVSRVFEQRDVDKLIKENHIRQDMHGEIMMPIGIYINVDMNKLVGKVSQSKVVQEGLKPEPNQTTVTLENSVCVGCKLPPESIIRGGAFLGTKVNIGTIGSGSLVSDVLISGVVRTGTNCFIENPDICYDVEVGVNNTICSRHSYGVTNTNIGPDTVIMGGKVKGCYYSEGVDIVDYTHENYSPRVAQYKDTITSNVILSELSDTKLTADLGFVNSSIAADTVVEIHPSASDVRAFPNVNEDSGGGVKVLFGHTAGNYLKEKESIRLSVLDNKSLIVSQDVTDWIMDNAIKINKVVEEHIIEPFLYESISNKELSNLKRNCSALLRSTVANVAKKTIKVQDPLQDRETAKALTTKLNEYFHNAKGSPENGKPQFSEKDAKAIMITVAKEIPSVQKFNFVQQKNMNKVKSKPSFQGFGAIQENIQPIDPIAYAKRKEEIAVHNIAATQAQVQPTNDVEMKERRSFVGNK